MVLTGRQGKLGGGEETSERRGRRTLGMFRMESMGVRLMECHTQGMQLRQKRWLYVTGVCL